MTPGKRVFDLLFSTCLIFILGPVILLVAFVVLVTDGRPVLYVAERMKTPQTSFGLFKFRTMTNVSVDSGVSGGDKADRITPIGRLLRRNRVDELPQLFNIFIGDMSFVGPRPPLRRYVELRPDLYARVLRSRPGVTGMATVWFHKREAKLLAPCETAEETESVYLTRCVPQKARLDLIYQSNRNFCVDLLLIAKTLSPGVELVRRRSKHIETERLFRDPVKK